METSEMKYREILGAVSQAISRGLDVEMTCANGIVERITAGRIIHKAVKESQVSSLEFLLG